MTDSDQIAIQLEIAEQPTISLEMSGPPGPRGPTGTVNDADFIDLVAVFEAGIA